MNKIIIFVLVIAGMLTQGASAIAAAQYKIVTASERGTYIKIGRDLAQFVAPSADIDLEAIPSAGSAENVRRLRYEPGVKLALVQSDVYQSYVDLAEGGNTSAASLIRPMRVIMPLYNEEIYFIVRADSALNYVHEIKASSINAGELGSGTALTSATLYRLMFGESMPQTKTSYLSNEEALTKLVTDKSLDVVTVVAGQPAKLLVDMKPDSRQLIKLLKFDPNHASSKAVLKTYFSANVRASSYPNLLTADLAGLAVKALLVTYDFQLKDTGGRLKQLAHALCQNFTTLQAHGHPKWREVELALPDLGRGWFYYAPTAQVIRNCNPIATKLAKQVLTRSPKLCTQQEHILGLCK